MLKWVLLASLPLNTYGVCASFFPSKHHRLEIRKTIDEAKFQTDFEIVSSNSSLREAEIVVFGGYHRHELNSAETPKSSAVNRTVNGVINSIGRPSDVVLIEGRRAGDLFSPSRDTSTSEIAVPGLRIGGWEHPTLSQHALAINSLLALSWKRLKSDWSIQNFQHFAEFATNFFEMSIRFRNSHLLDVTDSVAQTPGVQRIFVRIGTGHLTDPFFLASLRRSGKKFVVLAETTSLADAREDLSEIQSTVDAYKRYMDLYKPDAFNPIAERERAYAIFENTLKELDKDLASDGPPLRIPVRPIRDDPSLADWSTAGTL